MENGNVLGEEEGESTWGAAGITADRTWGAQTPLSHPAASFLLALEEMGTSISSTVS